jgi:hypothetical protein
MIGGPEDDKPIVIVRSEDDDSVQVMDREMYEYTRGLRQGETPAQAALDEVLSQADRVIVLWGPVYRGQPMSRDVLLRTEDAEELDALAAALRIDADPSTFNHCACLGGPALLLCRGDAPLATLGIHHGASIRWAHWNLDARLADSEALTKWLVRNGIEADFLKEHYETNHLFDS